MEYKRDKSLKDCQILRGTVSKSSQGGRDGWRCVVWVDESQRGQMKWINTSSKSVRMSVCIFECSEEFRRNPE